MSDLELARLRRKRLLTREELERLCRYCPGLRFDEETKRVLIRGLVTRRSRSGKARFRTYEVEVGPEVRVRFSGMRGHQNLCAREGYAHPRAGDRLTISVKPRVVQGVERGTFFLHQKSPRVCVPTPSRYHDTAACLLCGAKVLSRGQQLWICPICLGNVTAFTTRAALRAFLHLLFGVGRAYAYEEPETQHVRVVVTPGVPELQERVRTLKILWSRLAPAHILLDVHVGPTPPPWMNPIASTLVGEDS